MRLGYAGDSLGGDDEARVAHHGLEHHRSDLALVLRKDLGVAQGTMEEYKERPWPPRLTALLVLLKIQFSFEAPFFIPCWLLFQLPF